MKKYLAFLLAVSGMIAACQNDWSDDSVQRIPMNDKVAGQTVSDVLELQGFTVLDNSAGNALRSCSKVLFSNNKIIVLDNQTDYQDIWVFNESDGKFLHKIGRQSSEPDGYEGLNDIALYGDGNAIRCSAAGKLAFMDYDLDGRLIGSTASGIFGEELEWMPGDHFVAYNEYNATPISGMNHLLFYDSKGNIEKRLFPYPEAMNNNGFTFSGFLSKSGEGLWFSPPFSDTVFEIGKNTCSPRYVLDFGRPPLQESLASNVADGWDVHNEAYLGESFVKTGHFIFMQYYRDKKISAGIFDEQSGRFMAFRDAPRDYLYELVQLGDLYPKDNATVALALQPGRIRHLVSNGLLDASGLKTQLPQLWNTLQTVQANDNPVLLYLSVKPGARISDTADARLR